MTKNMNPKNNELSANIRNAADLGALKAAVGAYRDCCPDDTAWEALAYALHHCGAGEARKKSVHSERLAAMGQMAAAISHELRNPLSGIKVAAEYLMRKLKEKPELYDIVVNIHNEVIFANTIISNILEHARISTPALEKTSVRKIIEETVLAVAQQGAFNNIEIKKTIAADLPLILLDPLQMRQVLMNVFINASEAMIGGGTLTIDAAVCNGAVQIRVTDTGAGIEESHLGKIFEPFFSTKVRGIGIGLSITKEIIENHGGSISITSKLGKGTTITIILPLVNEGS